MVKYLLPFTYFYDTRLRCGSVMFHALFEWLAAAILVGLLGVAGPTQSLWLALLSYLAFISLYEVGYIVNDLFASAKEEGGRKRGPQGAGWGWVASWFAARMFAFILATSFAGHALNPAWWSFFGALALVFALHNVLTDRELKSATFIWLGWFRFMAPLMFAVQPSQLMGIACAAAMTYVGFRLLGYLDSKGLLKMPGRQRLKFRLFFFCMSMTGALALGFNDEARGFVLLTSYFSFVALIGAATTLAFNVMRGQG